MSNKKNRQSSAPRPQRGGMPRQPQPGPDPPAMVPSLLGAMVDGNEYASIVSLLPQDGDLVRELKAGIAEVETVRKRPCLCYVSNVIKPGFAMGIDLSDDLPFNEMISLVDAAVMDVDVLLVTPGGSATQVSQLVNALRSRFDTVEFILPHMAMSAGTLWALSGDRIWMDSRAYIGPIDPQVPISGQYVPSQSILTMLHHIQEEGQKAIDNQQPPPWSLIRLLDNMDPRLLGEAMTSSQYSITMARDFLIKYKFKTWKKRKSTGEKVTDAIREERAAEIAELLCSNERWKLHGHGITREVAHDELHLLIDHIEAQPGLERAVRRLWALLYYVFDRTPIGKMFLSQQYTLLRFAQPMTVGEVT